jgi:hypothetical protein
MSMNTSHISCLSELSCFSEVTTSLSRMENEMEIGLGRPEG